MDSVAGVPIKMFQEPTPALLKVFQKYKEKARFSNLFYEAIIILIPKQTRTSQEGKKCTSISYIDAKILNKMQVNQIP